MAGLLDFLNTPAGMGLLSAAAGGLAGARRGTPWNNVGRGAVSGLMGYSNAQDQIRQDEENAFAKQYKQMQMEQMQAAVEQQRAMREAGRVAAERSMIPQFAVGGQTFPTREAAQAEAVPQTVYTGTMPQSPLVSGELGAPEAPMTDYSGASDFAMQPLPQQRPAQPVTEQGQFDPNAYSAAMMTELARRGLADEAMKYAPKVQEPIKVGDTLIDPRTFKPLYQAPQTIDYNKPFLPDGRPNMPYQQFATSKARAGAPSVNVAGTRVYNEAEKKLGAGMGDYAIDLRKNADSAYRAADEVNYVVDALQGYGGGPLTSAKAFLGRFSPDSEWGRLASVGELANTVQAKLAPSMRAAGSGATSDFEMKMWMKAIPTLATTEVGRELMRKYTNRVAERAAARADIEAQLIDERGRVEYAEVYRRMKARFGDRFLDPEDAAMLRGKSVPGKQPAAPGGVKFMGFEEN